MRTVSPECQAQRESGAQGQPGLGGRGAGRSPPAERLHLLVPQRGDPATYVGAALALGLVAVAACLVPALRATRVDAAVMIRSE